MSKCPKCGAKLDADDEFCPECGAKVRQPTQAPPAREAMQIVMQQAQPKKHGFLTVVIIIIVMIFLFKACAIFASEPQLPARTYQPEYAQEAPAPGERLISIETPPPRVNPIPEPEPLPNKEVECSGASVKITDACFSCGLLDCGLLAKVENKGSKPIISFVTRSYVNEMNKDESRDFTLVGTGMSAEIGIHKQSNEIRMIELIPVIVVGGTEIKCEAQAARYGNAYGSPFGECGLYGGTETTPVDAEPTTYGGYDATYDTGY
ncbi:MAG: zinc ribbon domain-containing protein [Nanoarchaeota archaeon]|nr:zinc ribbon domain-containing protein [Nanoarchaeota archaeon]